MFGKAILVSFLILAVTLHDSARAGHERWLVLEVTPDAIKVGGAAKTAVYKFSNALLTNTVPASYDLSVRGKITDVKPGCNILLEIGSEGGQTVILALEVSK
jgi:hypothetical protein